MRRLERTILVAALLIGFERCVLVSSLVGAAVGGVVIGAAFNSYQKHASPVRAGVTYGVGTLIVSLIAGSVVIAKTGTGGR